MTRTTLSPWRRRILMQISFPQEAWSITQSKLKSVRVLIIGCVALAAVTVTMILVPCFIEVKSLRLIWRSGTRRTVERVPDLQMSYIDLNALVPIIGTSFQQPSKGYLAEKSMTLAGARSSIRPAKNAKASECAIRGHPAQRAICHA